MREAMASVGQAEALDYLVGAANAGKLPVAEVVEEVEPPGQSGRLVRLTCGDTTVDVRELVAGFEDGHFDFHAFWKAPVAPLLENQNQLQAEVLPLLL